MTVNEKTLPEALNWDYDCVVMQLADIEEEIIKFYPEIKSILKPVSFNGSIGVFKKFDRGDSARSKNLLTEDFLGLYPDDGTSEYEMDIWPCRKSARCRGAYCGFIYGGDYYNSAEMKPGEEFGATCAHEFSIEHPTGLLWYATGALKKNQDLSGIKIVISIENEGSTIHYYAVDLANRVFQMPRYRIETEALGAKMPLDKAIKSYEDFYSVWNRFSAWTVIPRLEPGEYSAKFYFWNTQRKRLEYCGADITGMWGK
jgi:hypothetical protein